MINVNKTQFNKKAIEGMTFKAFEKVYRNKIGKSVDLKALFITNGGKLDKPKESDNT